MNRSNANVREKSNNQIKTEVYYDPEKNSVTHPITDRGGKREGAGRKRLPPAVTKEDKEFYSRFGYGLNMIAECEFSIDYICQNILKKPDYQRNFPLTLKLLITINERLVDARG